MTTDSRFFAFSDDGVPSDSIVLPDGTLWSHAATPGSYVYGGSAFALDRDVLEGFIRNFTSGYPKKVPVDYEHSSTTSDPEIKKLRAQGKVPMAGEAVEFRAVFSAEEFTGELRRSAEALAKKAGRKLDDPRNFGLWMRWHPTEDALKTIRARHLSQLSIAFGEVTDNKSGKSNGLGLVAVGLVARPFIDDMISVAASANAKADDIAPAAPATSQQEHTMTAVANVRLLTALAAVLPAAVNDEEQAITQLGQLGPEIKQLRAFRDAVTPELGEVETPKVVEKIRALKAENTQFKADALEAKKRAMKITVDDTMKKHEKKFSSVPQRDLMAKMLTAELEAGTALEETETVKALSSMTESGVTGQISLGDAGEKATDDVKIDRKAKELMETDAAVKELRAKEGFAPAFRLALTKAREALSGASTT